MNNLASKVITVRRVVGKSMLPSLRQGSIVFAWRFKKPKVGDIVIAKLGDVEVIKRVFSYNKSGYYLLGDNLSCSTDSRKHGRVPSSKVIAVVIGGQKIK